MIFIIMWIILNLFYNKLRQQWNNKTKILKKDNKSIHKNNHQNLSYPNQLEEPIFAVYVDQN